MSTRYLDARRCKMIAEALEYTGKMKANEISREMREVSEQMQDLFRERSEPDSGVILTFPGEES